ncbi:MAG TPA: type IV pilus twitching motility protein PilT [Aquifex aeolicus]|uniref:Type IV pilus twitching motility protein PilT n=1 Tax=Aquifex aeolicus TaxID=63363 RepID=A0A9D0YQF8_AQUAO|nr:type IV pilus twitching motility protein PilT [Aquificales bacterium]HIP98774.1 type IV pilus twitching motility protein PilT [Aquifex aeolicus]HIQ25939.1 type IV pilus twitching motility protein PilT [Aquifex aeolicus]
MAEVYITEILEDAVKQGASDIHITVGTKPRVRIDGKIQELTRFPMITPDMSKKLIFEIMKERYRKELEERGQVDFSFGVPGVGRFRVNAFYQRGTVAAVFRTLPAKIPHYRDLGLPERIIDLCHKSMGLVLVTGPTGSGKSTTLAAMIDYILENFPHHVLTIEDPIEYLFKHKKGIINQREVGTDAPDFNQALRAALREDPDVIMVGEMRDTETIETALRAAETGHLVFGTLHTNTAVSTINRIVDVFPPEKQEQIRIQLSFTLAGVISQRLVPKIGGGRVLAYELLIPNKAIRNLIRENKLQQVYSLMQSGQSQTGMQTMNQSLARLYNEGLITLETAVRYSPDPMELAKLLGIPYSQIAHLTEEV